MKKKQVQLLLALFTVISFQKIVSQANNDPFTITQDNVRNGRFTPFKLVNEDKPKQQNPIKRFEIDITKTQEDYPDRKFRILYGGKTLNLLFANKLATNFNTSNDLTLQKSYFNVDAAEKSFSLGYNIDNRNGDPLKQLNWLVSIGAKVLSSDGFATLATGSDLEENNIGFNLKYSFINNGRIGWRTSYKRDEVQIQEKLEKKDEKFQNQREIVENNRAFLNFKYDEKVKEFNQKELPKIESKNIKLYGEDEGKLKTIKAIEEKSNQLFYEMIKEEIDFVESNNLFTVLYNSWFTIETYIPVGDKEFNTTPITEENKATRVMYYPFNLNGSYNFYKEKPEWFSYFGKIILGVRGNSNIEVNNLKPKEFQSITTVEGEPVLTSPVSAIEVSEFDRFVTTSVKAEIALFFKNWIGFSPSIEKNFGTYDAVNWKLGIPFSLKDKDGKPTVNFELQWRETQTLTSSRHLFGFSTSFFFGDLLKKD